MMGYSIILTSVWLGKNYNIKLKIIGITLEYLMSHNCNYLYLIGILGTNNCGEIICIR